ncbi:hypothetical protein AK812_SmicGene36265 [Symbiodinium microadriaticum]|uniref:Uncharacterized protein n=1 Tax=Symbiodinium microadriaticum TaxID=2951 RepID=A0A1Q9CJE5_SYMMI|nr:hypothetical protein AK812_SmicGene36265 [Symbiodinium microadriaticum]CAE7948931.1 unnamed protein product [Symbiodinium sp. KB8]
MLPGACCLKLWVSGQRLHDAVRLNHAIHRSCQDRALSIEILPNMECRLLKIFLGALVAETTGVANSLNQLPAASDVANLGETEIESSADALHPLRKVETVTGDQHRLRPSESARNVQLQNYSAIQEEGALAARTTYVSASQDQNAQPPEANAPWSVKTVAIPSQTCPTCCRGSFLEMCPSQVPGDACASQLTCSGYHRCSGAANGFVQCQPKPGSEVICQTGPNCLPECIGSHVGKEGDDCALQSLTECEGHYVRRGSRAVQCKVSRGGNPSGADMCENSFLCGT